LDEQLELLINLQEIDSSILSITEVIELLPNKLAKVKVNLKKASDKCETVKAEHDKLDEKKKGKYNELDEMQDKIDKLKVKSTEIKTNKEYEAHLREIKNFEERKNQIEEVILSVMEKLDNFAEDLKKEQEKFRKTEEHYKHEEKVLDEEKNKLHSEMEIYKSKRKEIVRKIHEEIYDRYMDLIKSGGGKAVVQTKNEVCLGCNTNIPPQLYNDIKSDKGIFNCYYCNRFLYFSPKTEKTNP
jgi:predicted  nucleic acid-binding Zn-ribbon protein